MSLEFSESELKAIRATYCAGFTDEQFEVCMTFCRVRNLLPGKHVIFQLRRTKEWDESANAKVPVTKIIFITTIDASRLIAQRTGQYAGQAPEQYIYLDENGSPSLMSEVPLPQLPLPPKGTTALPREPWAVKTTVFRKDFPQPVSSIARFDAYASTFNTANGPQLNEMWARRGPEQLAKCSEMLSLRKAFPEELGGIYLAEEFKPEHEEIAQQPVSPSVAVPVAPVVPKVNNTPAVATETPRPGEEVKVEHHVSSVPATLPENSGSVLVVKPETEPISQIEKPKRGRKSKAEPVQKVDKPVDQGITDEDTAILDGIPKPESEKFDHEANLKESREFVEEASKIDLPTGQADPVPTKEQQKAFAGRARALVEPGVDIAAIGAYTLGIGQKTASSSLTIGDWTKALTRLEKAKKDGNLKEVVKEAPVAPF